MRTIARTLLACVVLTASVARASSDWNSADYDLYPGDFNGDGKTDLLYVAIAANKESGIALSNGTLPMGRSQVWTSGAFGIPWHSHVYIPVIGDFNWDGRADIFMHRQTPGDHYLLLSNSDGTFSGMSQTIANVTASLTWSGDQHRIISVAASSTADPNHLRGHRLFLQAVAKGGSNALITTSFAGLIGGVFGSPWTDGYQTFQWNLRQAIVHSGDFNGDGNGDLLIQAKPDIVLIDYDVAIPVPHYRPQSFGIVFSPIGSAGYQMWDRMTGGVDWSATQSNLTIGDFDGNGRDDVLVQSKRAAANTRLALGNIDTNQLTVATPVTVSFSGAASVGGDAVRIIAGNFDGGSSGGVYLQATSAGGSDLIAAALPAAGGTASTISQTSQSQAPVVTSVGSLPGVADVSTTGAGTYEIPLWVPPGTNNLQPELALAYSSQNGAGNFGAGWQLKGLSAIARCGKTRDQNGEARAVHNDVNDRLCLDGNQLKLFAGTYTGANSEYRTEIETYSRINAYGTAGTPEYFIAERKDGLIYEYGHTSDSQVLSVAQSVARVWAVNKISDRAGNAMLFTYEEDTTNGSFRIKEIAYTSNSAAGLSARYKVTFFYEALPAGEKYLSYQANSIIKRITRADRIEVSYDGALVRKYDLTYESALSSTSKSRLASIQACANATPPDCLPPTTFNYQNGTPGVSSEVNSPNNLPLVSALLLDVNGDGRKDMVYSSSATSGAGTWKLALANTSGNYDPASNASGSAVTNTSFTMATPIDYNADGLEDLLLPQPSTNTWWVMLGTQTGLASPVDTEAPVVGGTRAIDMDGDGWQDLVEMGLFGFAGGDYMRYRLRVPAAKFATSTSLIVGPLPVNWKINDAFGDGYSDPADFNGDGRGDVMYRYTIRVWNPEFQAYDAVTRLVVLCSGPDGQTFQTNVSTSTAPFLGDMNGDGRTDIVYSTGGLNSTYRMRLSTGTAFTAEIGGPNVDVYDYPGVLLDWDGDGSDDLVLHKFSDHTLYVFRSLGDGFAAPFTASVGNANNLISLAAVDVNGDGLKDLAYYDLVNSNKWSVRLHNGVMPDLLTAVTDGFGMTTNFSYAPLTTANYTKYADAVAPEQDYKGSLHVVSTMTGSTAVPSAPTYTKTYQYQGARMNLTGRGFLGFEQVRSQDLRNDLWQYSYFHRAFPYIGQLFEQRIYKSDQSTLIGKVEQRWTKHDYNVGAEAQRHFPFIDKTTTTQYEIDGDQIATVVQDVAVDSATGTVYDTTTTSTELASANGVQNGAVYTQRVYHPLASLVTSTSGTNWCLGMPGQTQLINSHNQTDGASVTRTVSRSWDTTKCRLNSETLQPGDPQWQVATALTYDDAAGENDPDVGHVTKVEVTGANMATRVTKVSWADTGGRFPNKLSLKSTTTLWEETLFLWDAEKGLPIRSTDPNGLAVNFTYDNFGRRIRESRPDGTSTTWGFSRCTGTSCIGDSSLRWYVHETQFANDGSSINSADTYFDAAGRVRYEDSPTLSGSSRVASTYDALGRLTQQTLPYSIGSTTFSQTFGYDLANRVTSIARPISATNLTTQTTSISYDGLSTTVQDALGQSQTRVKNVWGLMARSADAAGYYQNFAYDAFGDLTRVTDSATPTNTLQTISYNVLGMKIGMSDMDAGTYTYQPNALGEVEYVRDLKTTAPAWTTEMTFDLLGRMKTRKDVAENVTSQFNFGTAAPSIGQLTSVSGGGHTEAFEYDNTSGRLKTRTITSDSTYVFDYSYNALGLLDVLQYPTSTSYRFAVKYEYTNGFPSSVKDNQAGTVFWRASASDAFGNVTSERLGNGLQTTRGFDAVTGLLGSIQTVNASGGSIQNLAYAWDKVGNLQQRRDVGQDLTELFYYDNVNRLDCSTLNVPAQANCAALTPAQMNLNVAYDQLGNITSKSNVGGTGVYAYDTTKKHRATSAGSHTYGYDLNGNVNSRDGLAITWYSYNLPNVINGAGSSSSQFSYTAERERWKQVANAGLPSETTTIYIGGLVEKVKLGTVTSWRHYIAGGSGPVAIYTRKDTGTNEVHYLTTDHLGSIDSITDSSGNAEVLLSYGAFGERRKAVGWSGNPTQAEWDEITDDTRRGFTSHEMLDFLNLTHMNGRVYDQITGRFLSADPFVPVPEFTQSFNRYSYVFNNPLRYTDPTGFNPSPDDPVDPPGPNCLAVCFDPGFAPDFIGGGKRVPHGRPVPWIGLRNGARFVPVNGIECDMVSCDGAPKRNMVQKIGAFIFPTVAALGERGVPGTTTNNIVGGLKAAYNIVQGLAVAADPNLAIQAAFGNGPQPLEIADNELAGAALVEGASAIGGLVGVERALAARGSLRLREIAERIRNAATHRLARDRRTIAVGADAQGRLHAASSNGFDRGQRAAAEAMGVRCVTCKAGAHAEENLMREVPGLRRVGTSARSPCGPGEHNCRGQLSERGIDIEE